MLLSVCLALATACCPYGEVCDVACGGSADDDNYCSGTCVNSTSQGNDLDAAHGSSPSRTSDDGGLPAYGVILISLGVFCVVLVATLTALHWRKARKEGEVVLNERLLLEERGTVKEA